MNIIKAREILQTRLFKMQLGSQDPEVIAEGYEAAGYLECYEQVKSLMQEAMNLRAIVIGGRGHDPECRYHLDKKYPCAHHQAVTAFDSIRKEINEEDHIPDVRKKGE